MYNILINNDNNFLQRGRILKRIATKFTTRFMKTVCGTNRRARSADFVLRWLAKRDSWIMCHTVKLLEKNFVLLPVLAKAATATE